MYRQYFLFIFLFVVSVSGNTQSRKSILFLGNSYTAVNSLPQLLYNLAITNQDTLDYDSYTPGGYTFQGHSQDVNALAKIQQKPWDYVVLQEQSQLPSFSPAQVASDVFPYARKLDSLIHVNHACTQTVFYMTWGRKYGDAQNCASYPPVCSYSGMSTRLRSSYVQMADMNEAVVSPAGMAWMASRAADSTINLWSSDNSHPSMAGSYLTACVFYATIYEKTPIGLSFTAGLPQATVSFLQAIAHQTVFDSLSTWNINVYDPIAGFGLTQNGYGLIAQNTSQQSNSWFWNFGDGSALSAFEPEYTYAQPGNYTLTQIVSDGCLSDTATQNVTISPPALAWDIAETMEKGMNLSYMENYWVGDSAVGYSDYLHHLPIVSEYRDDVELMQEMGFKTLRLPVCFEVWAGNTPPYLIDSTHYFALIDSFILWTGQQGMNLIIDYHHGRLDSATLDTDLAKIQSIWEQIVARYSQASHSRVFFEVFNEPKNLSTEQWKTAATAIIRSIHTIDPERMLIVGGSNWNSRWGLTQMGALPDSNVIYTFHYYDPMIFTHQGATWGGDAVATTNIPFPYDAGTMPPLNPITTGTWGESDYNTYNVWGNKDSLTSDIFAIKKWSNETQLPLFCGEWGSYKPFIPNDGSRCRYTEAVKTALDSFMIPYSYWEWDMGFSLFDGMPSLDSLSVCMADIWDVSITAISPHAEMNVVIYPNPATEKLFIRTEEPEKIQVVRLYDYQGRVLFSIPFSTEVALKGLTSGVYFLELSGYGRENRYKVVIR